MKRLVIAALLLFALAACRTGTEIVVHTDGSGTYSTIVTADGTAGNHVYDAVVRAARKSGVPLTVSRYSSGAESGAKLSCTFRSLDDLVAMSKKLGAASGAQLGGVRIGRSDTGWTFSAAVHGGLVGTPGAIETGAPGGTIDPTQLAALVHISVAVTLPGAPGVNNATSVTHTSTSTRFTWALAVGHTAGTLQAATTFVGNQGSIPLATALTPLGEHAGDSSSGVSSWVWVGVGTAVVVMVAALILFLRRRQPPSAPEPQPEPAMAGPGDD